MKKINEMSVKELREVAKGYNVAGRWDMTKAQLVEAIQKIENEKAAAKKAKKEVKAKKESSKEKVMKVQRAFVAAGEARKEVYCYITITIKNVDEHQAGDYIDAVCAKMTEMDEEFKVEYKALRCPDYDEETKSYTDTIAFNKVKGQIAVQRSYVGKLMTKAMAAIK